MKELKSMMNQDVDLFENRLKEKYSSLMNNNDFSKKALSLDVDDVYIYTNEIEKVVTEYNNCFNCTSLETCSNSMYGHKFDIRSQNRILVEEYFMCEKLKSSMYLNNIYIYGKQADEIIVNQKLYPNESRIPVVKYCAEIIDTEDLTKKGLYVYGSFGTGKSYLLSVLVKELAKKGYKCGIAFFPEMLIQIKDSFSKQEDVLGKIKSLDVLVIDDIGAENVTAWSRDEVLSSLLQYRMENKLFTCFTSNYNIIELEKHLAKGRDTVAAKRIIDRVRFLSTEFELKGANYRHKTEGEF